MQVPHIPVLRLGRPYESLDRFDVKDHRTGESKAAVSKVTAGIIRKVSWDQPHEGNMFEFLWRRRSIERGW